MAAERIRLRPEERRTQLLDTAQRMMFAPPGAPPSMDELAEATGVSRALVYNYFDSHAGLCLALLDREIARFDIEAVEQLANITDPDNWLVTSTKVYFDAVEATGALYLTLFANRQADQHVEQRRLQRQRFLTDAVAIQFRHLFGIGRSDAHITAALVLGMLNSAAELVAVDKHDRHDIESAYLTAARSILAASKATT